MNENLRPIDRFVKHSTEALQKEYLVIGKTRVSRLTSWAVLAFFLGMTLTIGFLASRTGTFEGSEAARATKPTYSSWSKAQEGNCEGKTSATAQCRSAKVRKTVIEGGKRKTITVEGFQTRSCTKNCPSEQREAAAESIQTYKASTDFSSTQGAPKPWYYLDSNGNQLTYNATNPNAGNQPAWQGNEQYLLVGNNWQHPGQDTDSVRRWVAPGGGTIHITGNVHDNDASCGEGVVVTIKRNGTQLWNASIANGDSTGQNFDSSVSVASQDRIDFIVNRGSPNNYCDSTFLDPTIDFTPAGTATGNVYVSVRLNGSQSEPCTTDGCFSGINGSFIKPGGETISFTNLPHWYDRSIPMPVGQYTFNSPTALPPGYSFDGITCVNNSDCTLSKGKTLSAYYKLTSVTNTLTVSKTYLEVAPLDADTQVKLDSGTLTSGNPVVFSNVSAGSHTLTIEVPANTKAFYAICTNADTCINEPVNKDGNMGSGTGTAVKTITTLPFTHTAGQNDFVSIYYTKANIIYKTDMQGFNTNAVIPKIYASTITPVRVRHALWDPRTRKKTCSIDFYVADEPGDDNVIDGVGDLYTEVSSAVISWKDGVTNVTVSFQGKHFPPSVGSVNGIRTYGFDESDNKNTISYTSQAKGFIGVTFFYGFWENVNIFGGNAVVPKYVIQTDIGLDPEVSFFIGSTASQGRSDLRSVLKHEVGHALGLDESGGVSSIMGTTQIDITVNDITTVNDLYSSCAGTPTKAFISIYLPETARITSPSESEKICHDYPTSLSWWSFVGMIAEKSGNLGVQLDEIEAYYYIYPSGATMKTLIGEVPLPFTRFQLPGSAPYGFPSNRIEPFGIIPGIFCQVPWIPEVLDTITLNAKGTDDKGNFVEDNASTILIPSSL